MPNAWVIHVKKFASENNKSYGCAISDPECKSNYKKINRKPKLKEEKPTYKNINEINASRKESTRYFNKMNSQQRRKIKSESFAPNNIKTMNAIELEKEREENNAPPYWLTAGNLKSIKKKKKSLII